MEKTIRFMKVRYIGYIASASMFIFFSAGTYFNGGFNWGIDFVGGVKLVVKFEQGVPAAKINEVLEKKKIKAEVQQYGKEDQNEYIISMRLMGQGETSEKTADLLKSALDSDIKNVQYLSTETVGPAVGDFLKKSAAKLIIACLVLMGVYLAFRFQLKYSVSGVMMLIHDVALSVLFLGLMRIEINIPIVAGVLTIFGYSINDTIVVYDRIRENLKSASKEGLQELIDQSITQTLSRTILTVLTTLFGVFCLYIIGVDIINDFALLLLVGFTLGVYSTFFVACPLVLAWDKYIDKN